MIKKVLITGFLMTSILLLQGFSDINIFKHGENIIVEKDVTVNNVVCVKGDVTINGTVEENLVVLFGNAALGRDSVVKGEVVVVNGTVDKSRTATVEGGVTSLSSEQVTKISKSFKTCHPKAPPIFNYVGPVLDIIFLILTLLAVLIFPKTIGGLSFIAENKPWKTLGVGIISSLLIIPIMVLLVLSLIGIAFIPLFCIALALLVFFGTVAITQLVGKKTVSLFRKKGIPILWETIIGIAILYLLKLLPIFGGIISVVVCTFALGAGVLYLIGLRKTEKTEKVA